MPEPGRIGGDGSNKEDDRGTSAPPEQPLSDDGTTNNNNNNSSNKIGSLPPADESLTASSKSDLPPDEEWPPRDGDGDGGEDEMTKDEESVAGVESATPCSPRLGRGGGLEEEEEEEEGGENLSEMERVWEVVTELVDKPAAIASAETLLDTSASGTSAATLHFLPPRSLTTSSAPPPQCERLLLSSSVRRSFSFADSSSALKTSCYAARGKLSAGKAPLLPPRGCHKKSPSVGSAPVDGSRVFPEVVVGGRLLCDHDPRVSKPNTKEVELHVRVPQMEVEAHSVVLQEGAKASEEIPDRLSDDEESVRPSSSKRRHRRPCSFSSGIGEPSVYHALVVIFLEFFAWGLLTSPMILVLKKTFPDHTFLMNGIIMGIKGLLSFLSAPLIGALSDVWGRKFFLFITVFFTCLPIPFMKINTWWYFALISMSGVFAVTYSIVFAYVADVTDPAERHHAYGLVSATFAASLVTSPALGAYLSKVHSDDLVVGLATAIAVLDIFFILVAVPESLPEKLRLSSASTWSTQISWEQADPFSTLWKVSKDRNILLISVTVFLSYLPEAGQLSCFFVYLQLVMGFGPEMVATFIAVVGIMSVVAQTALLGLLIRTLSNKRVISVGLVFELLQLMWYGFGSQTWMMWAAGILAAISSITYPAISAYVSTHTDIDKQGVVQGIVTGMRGLCAGLGPAVFGFIFYLFHVDLNQGTGPEQNTSLPSVGGGGSSNTSLLTQSHHVPSSISPQVPGPPFVFGAMLVLLALTVSAFIPEGTSKHRKQSVNALDLGYSRDHKKSDSLDGTSQPLMNETGVL